MKKNIIFTIALTLSFCLGFALNEFALSNIPTSYKVAVVDIQKVIDASPQLKKLKAEREQKNKELNKWVEVVKADINKQTSQENKKKLSEKYNTILVQKQKNLALEYGKKLQEFDKQISEIVANQAKSKGYNLVLVKSTVIFGGEDITQNVIKSLK